MRWVHRLAVGVRQIGAAGADDDDLDAVPLRLAVELGADLGHQPLAFVAHHGALGGFVRVYCLGGRATPEAVIRKVMVIPGVAAAYDRRTTCERFGLPPDREGDVAVIAAADACIGGSAAAHDLSGLAGHRLRTLGGTTEARVPFVISEPVGTAWQAVARGRPLNSYELFDFVLNGVAA